MKFLKKKPIPKGLILAAGRGSRLNELTLEKPKCFIKICHKTLISYQIEALQKAGIKNVAIVTGYLNEHFNKIHLKKFFNSNWGKTNMVYSMICAKEWFSNDVVVSYSDIIYPYKVVKKLISLEDDFVIVADLKWKELWKKRFENPFEDAETLKMHNNYLIEIGKKTNSYQDIDAQFIGLFKVSAKGLKIISEMMKKKIISENYDVTQTLDKIISQNYKVKVLLFDDTWFEIDNKKDLSIAEDYINKLKMK